VKFQHGPATVTMDTTVSGMPLVTGENWEDGIADHRSQETCLSQYTYSYEDLGGVGLHSFGSFRRNDSIAASPTWGRFFMLRKVENMYATLQRLSNNRREG